MNGIKCHLRFVQENVFRAVTVMHIEIENSHAFCTRRGGFERSYRAALRHSGYVRWLRICVPAGIAALLLTVVGINYMPPIGGFRLPGELGKLVIHGTRITMQQPRLAGYTNDSRAYEFSADAAGQDITKPNLV